jgi:hypothetical protein
LDGGRRGMRGVRPVASSGRCSPTGLAQVAVVPAADFRKLHDSACRGELDGPDIGCILGEREVRASLVIVAEVTGQDTAQVSLADNENMIQALASD